MVSLVVSLSLFYIQTGRFQATADKEKEEERERKRGTERAKEGDAGRRIRKELSSVDVVVLVD